MHFMHTDFIVLHTFHIMFFKEFSDTGLLKNCSLLDLQGFTMTL